MSDRPFAFFACRAALEREEHASQVYADLITRLAAGGQGHAKITRAVLGTLRIVADLSPTDPVREKRWDGGDSFAEHIHESLVTR
jgi:hypothetical protein